VEKAGLSASAEALLGHLDRAANAVREGLDLYRNGNRGSGSAATAQASWQVAARSIQAFIGGVGSLPPAVLSQEVRDRWLVRDEHPEYGTLGPTANQVLADLRVLSQDPLMLQGHPLTSLPGLEPGHWPPDDPPRIRTLEGSEYVPWSTIVAGERLYPNQFTALVIRDPLIAEGGALIIRGALQDDEGNEFKWLEQIVETPPAEMGSPEGIGSED
jgi:hypothetical protein